MHYVEAGYNLELFRHSNAFVRGIMGPVGSGKSTCCVAEILRRAMEQRPFEGVRRSRWVVIRNTYRELFSTTLKTWWDWVPKSQGHWREAGGEPPTHTLETLLPDGTKVHLEVLFIACDRPEDVKKLLSLEVTGAWINEAREVPKAIMDALTVRVGRYPGKALGGPSWSGVMMDTNPPDSDHWWYILAERDSTTERGRQLIESMLAAEHELQEAGLLGKGQPLFEFFRQPGGNDPAAENAQNLPSGYYIRGAAGKSKEWINVYINANYGFVMDGKAVIPEYSDSLHCQPTTAIRGRRLVVGIDFGLTPAAIIAQDTVMGAVLWHDELVVDATGPGMGARRFGELLAEKLRKEYGEWFNKGGFGVEAIGDPAGDARGHDAEEYTAFQHLRAGGVYARPAYTNDFTARREAIAFPLTRIIDARPGMVVAPKCLSARKGLMGGYCYKRVQIAGDERWHDKPDKTRYSHVVEAGGYANLELGQGRAAMQQATPTGSFPLPDTADVGDPFSWAGGGHGNFKFGGHS